jgi:hypothetical protein
MNRKCLVYGIALGCALATSGGVATAQTDPNAATAADTARITAETERLKAEAAKITAQADLERTKITSLGLPTYAGISKLNTGAGDMEAMLLTTPAVRLAGTMIAGKVQNGDVLLLTRDDAFDFGLVGSITAEIDGLTRQFEALGLQPPGPVRGPTIKLIPGAVAIISAIAGMARSETEVTAASVPVSDSMLLTAVAGTLKTRARLPAAAIGTVDVAPDGANSPLLARLGNLATLDALAHIKRDTLAASNGGKPSDDDKTAISAIDAVRKRYDTFFSRVASADAQGVVPIARAARLELLMQHISGVLRVHVEKSGGSLTNTKNLGTFFGLDPIRVTGGLVASYLLTRPSDGAVIEGGIVQCRTAMARLRKIQEGSVTYSSSPGAGKRETQTTAVCE